MLSKRQLPFPEFGTTLASSGKPLPLDLLGGGLKPATTPLWLLSLPASLAVSSFWLLLKIFSFDIHGICSGIPGSIGVLRGFGFLLSGLKRNHALSQQLPDPVIDWLARCLLDDGDGRSINVKGQLDGLSSSVGLLGNRSKNPSYALASWHFCD